MAVLRPAAQHLAGQFMRLVPQRIAAVRLASSPAFGQVGQIRQRHRQPGLAQHPQPLLFRPQHQGRALVASIERRALTRGARCERQHADAPDRLDALSMSEAADDEEA